MPSIEQPQSFSWRGCGFLGFCFVPEPHEQKFPLHLRNVKQDLFNKPLSLVENFVGCNLDSGNLLRPFSIGYIKGYKRCTALLILLQGIRELNLEDRVPQTIRVSLLKEA